MRHGFSQSDLQMAYRVPSFSSLPHLKDKSRKVWVEHQGGRTQHWWLDNTV